MYQTIKKIKKSDISIKMVEYKNALEKSLYDCDWIKNLYKDKTNLLQFLEQYGIVNIKAAVKFLETGSLQYIFEAQGKNILNEEVVKIFFEAGKSEQNCMLVDFVYQRTLYNAKITACLINEYAEYKRKFQKTEISPFPKTIDETWSGINTFKINQDVATLTKNTLCFESTCEFKEFFDERKKKKHLKKLFVPENLITTQQFQTIKRSLLQFKEFEIPSNYVKINKDISDYQITYYGNQTVRNDNYEFTLNGDNIKVLHINKVTL
jgi:hypothetical protein